ncbi:MAG: hypothetical protein J0M26_06455 [Planctomycetes bacterium]|nr:hypothetical protein [Planctomycetota bacterium]
MKKPIYFRQLNQIEVVVYHIGPGETYAVKFRKRSANGRMTSVFEPYDMAIIAFLASDVRHMFTDVGLGDIRPGDSVDSQEIITIPKKKDLT